MLIKYLLLDCDGVLHDNNERMASQARSIQKFYNRTIEEILDGYFAVHQQIHDDEPVEHDNIPRHFCLLGEKFGLAFSQTESDEQARLWQKAYADYYDHPRIYGDVKDFLAQIKSLGLSLALVSGSTEEERKKLLKAMGIGDHFKYIFAANSIGWQKQDKRFYEQVLKLLGISGHEAAIIGDSYNDDISAGRLGIKTILLARDSDGKSADNSVFKPDHIIKSLPEALPIVKLWMNR